MKKPQSHDLKRIKNEAAKVLKVWKTNREFRMSDATFEDFDKLSEEFDEALNKIESQNRELNEMRNTRDLAAAKLDQLNSRARSGMRGYFGPKSSQYMQVRDIDLTPMPGR